MLAFKTRAPQRPSINTSATRSRRLRVVVAITAASLVLLWFFFAWTARGPHNSTRLTVAADLSFSNTQTWGVSEMALLARFGPRHRRLLSFIPDAPPPLNDSEQTQNELAALRRMQEDRTPAQERAIFEERSDLGAVLRSWPSVTDADESALVAFDLAVVGPLVMYLKREYDRVRPSHLDPSLSTSIAVPPHPAYPSGHSTQVHVAAHFLSSKYPSQRDDYFRRAHDIATNREIAGVHYASDSDFGKLIAAIVTRFSESPLLAAA